MCVWFSFAAISLFLVSKMCFFFSLTFDILLLILLYIKFLFIFFVKHRFPQSYRVTTGVQVISSGYKRIIIRITNLWEKNCELKKIWEIKNWLNFFFDFMNIILELMLTVVCFWSVSCTTHLLCRITSVKIKQKVAKTRFR